MQSLRNSDPHETDDGHAVAERHGDRQDAPAAATDKRKTAPGGEGADKARQSGRSRRHFALAAFGGIVLLAAIAGGVWWWLRSQEYQTTSDAFIDARTASLGPDVPGRIIDVAVTNNQLVKPGTVLLKIDNRDYVAKVDQATAQVAEAKAKIATTQAQIAAQHAAVDQAQKKVNAAQAALSFARSQNQRAQTLQQQGQGTLQSAEQAHSTLQQEQAAYSSAQQGVTAAQKQLAVVEAQKQSAKAALQAAQAALEEAQVNLERTTLKAPFSGYVTKLGAAVGDYAQPGESLLMFVPKKVWVTANFKETQLTHMHPGEPVDIHIDAYPGKTFHGHVASIQAGSGAAFSLLPAENATGNFVKVVQRVPVRILFDKRPDVFLGPGMSVEPSVKVE